MRNYRIREDILSTGKKIYTIEEELTYRKYGLFGPEMSKWVELKECDEKYWEYNDECSKIVRFFEEEQAVKYLELLKKQTETRYIY